MASYNNHLATVKLALLCFTESDATCYLCINSTALLLWCRQLFTWAAYKNCVILKLIQIHESVKKKQKKKTSGIQLITTTAY